MNTSKCTNIQRRFIDANNFSIGPWGQSRERGFHVDRASMLRFIKVPHSQGFLCPVRGSDLISEQISELTSCSLIGSERSGACSVLLSEQKRRGAEY
jgi:hypothetical protein